MKLFGFQEHEAPGRSGIGKNVVFVNRFFYPDQSATSQMLSDLAFGLAARGYRITVVTSRIGYENTGETLPKRETVRGVEIVRVSTSRFGRAVLAGRALDYATFYILAGLTLLRLLKRDDVVVFKTDPPAMSVFLAPIAHLKRTRVMNWLQDVFPEIATLLGIGSGGITRFATKLLLGLRNRSLRKSAMNVVIGQRMADHVRQAGVAAETLRVIPNWADARAIRPVPHAENPLRADWGLDDTFVVLYSGNFGRAHDVETVRSAIAILERDASTGGADGAPPIHWLFIGGGVHIDTLKRDAAEQAWTSVSFKPYQPRDMLAKTLSVGDVHLISLLTDLEGLIVPSKFYGIAAAGRASVHVGDADGEIGQMLRDHDIGRVVAPGDASGLVETLRALAKDPQACRVMGERARQVFEQSYDVQHAVDAWSEVLDVFVPSQPAMG